MSLDELDRMHQFVLQCLDDHIDECACCAMLGGCPEKHRLFALVGKWLGKLRYAQQQSGITRVRNQWGAWQ